MGQRIQQLEDALASLQSSVSSEPHFLLKADPPSLKRTPEQQSSDESAPPDSDVFNRTMEAFGTLTISNSGQSTYFGPSVAGSETSGGPSAGAYRPEGAAPELLNNLAAQTFMDGGYASGSDTYKSAVFMLLDFLPSSMRASNLCETYLENSSWHCQLVTRQELFGDFLAPIYKIKKEWEARTGQAISQIPPHKLAFLFLIFAQGALMDLTLPTHNEEAERYHHYARAALALRSLINAPTVEAVQAMVLMAHYRGAAGDRYSRDSIWALISMGCKIAQSVSRVSDPLYFDTWLIQGRPYSRSECVSVFSESGQLGTNLFPDRDPTRWHMDEKTVESRRRIFWEVYTADLMHSGLLGRPPSIELSYVDCAFPTDGENSDTQLRNWLYGFIRDVFGSVIKLTLAAAPPDYKKILELDRKVREMVLPPGIQFLLPHGEENDEYITPGVYLRRNLLSQFRSTSMLFIHKCFFTQALLDHPENPLSSVYATSFLAAYRAASAIIRSDVNFIGGFPALFVRWGPIWGQLFSSAMVVGSTAAKAPSSSMAFSAFEDLTIAVEMFEKAAKTSERARTALGILKKLKEKATQALLGHRNGGGSSSLDTHEDGTAELALFGGQTRLPVNKKSSPPGHIQHPTVVLPHRTLRPALSSLEEPNSAVIPDSLPALSEHMPPLNQAGIYAEPPAHPATDLSPSYWDQPTQNSFVAPPWIPNGPDDSQQSLEEIAPPSAAVPQPWGSSNLADLNMMITGDNDLDAQWHAFMRENGMEF
ncbi:hypothetical protein HWV62_95 [Athelia sp. TMB]|nr:hypothetical protein HWV62_95 [Athelia sp. TMB]